MEGFIKLHRKIVDWEWYTDQNTFCLFLHFLFKANWKDGRFRGIDVPRGSFITSLPSLSEETGLSVRQVRVAIDHLKMTGEVTVKIFPKWRMVTVVKYNDYQCDDRQDDRQVTGKRQASDRQVTAIEEYKKDKNIKKGKNEPNPQLKKIEELYMKEVMNDQLRDSL